MKKSTLIKAASMTLGLATLVAVQSNGGSRDDDRGRQHGHRITANAGSTFTLLPSGTPGVLNHTVDGVVQLSVLGNCTFHADVKAYLPTAAGEPFVLTGTAIFTSADGSATLAIEVEGWAAPDPANPGSFVDFHYDVTFSGGTGAFSTARGSAEIDGFGMFTSESAGKATWTMRGHIATAGQIDHQR